MNGLWSSGRCGLPRSERTPEEYGSVRPENPNVDAWLLRGRPGACSQISVAARRRQMRV